jgi:predicted lipid-binding transport protein (Tim44 family)
MPRKSSSSSTSRSAATRTAPPKQTNTSQVAKSGMAGGLMGSLMSGMVIFINY